MGAFNIINYCSFFFLDKTRTKPARADIPLTALTAMMEPLQPDLLSFPESDGCSEVELTGFSEIVLLGNEVVLFGSDVDSDVPGFELELLGPGVGVEPSG